MTVPARTWGRGGAPRRFSAAARLRSFRCAFSGVGEVLRSQHNARIHLAATAVVFVAGLLLQIDHAEWLAIAVVTGAVWTAEGLNTSIEALCDVVSPGFHPGVARAKDVAAGAVLLSAVAALFVGALVFLPRLSALIVY